MPLQPNDYDSPWKEALEHYFAPFLALLAPELHAQIDWKHSPQFLDKELQAITHNASAGRRYADKLVRMRGKSGRPALILVHVEVQGGSSGGPTALTRFRGRMFQYYCRIGERYRNSPPVGTNPTDSSDPIASSSETPSSPADHIASRAATDAALFSLGILTESTGGQPFLTYRQHYLGCGVQFRFPVVHLKMWEKEWGRLERLAESNPFALVIMAQLQAQANREGDARLASKTAITRLLYQYNYSGDDILRLFRLIDWFIILPANLEPAYAHAVDLIEQELKMAYVTSIERLGKQEGRQEGQIEGTSAVLRAQIQSKFGNLPAWARERIDNADIATLQRWALNVLNADSIEAVLEP